MKTLSIIWHLFAQFLKSRLAYRGDFVVEMISRFANLTLQLIFVEILYMHTQHVAGWSKWEILFILGFSMAAQAVFSLVAWNLFELPSRIVMGQFDRYLLRPLPTLTQVLCESMNMEGVQSALLGGLLMLVAMQNLELSFSLFDILSIAFLVFSAGLILIAVFIIVSSISFVAEDHVGLGAPVWNLIQFSRYPISIYHPLLQFILSWVIPFAYVGYYPSAFLMRPTEHLHQLWATPAMALAFWAVALWCWQGGIRRYGSVGN